MTNKELREMLEQYPDDALIAYRDYTKIDESYCTFASDVIMHERMLASVYTNESNKYFFRCRCHLQKAMQTPTIVLR